MSRVFWAAVGAAGGILAYRKWERIREEASQEGVIPVAHRMSKQAVTLATTARGVLVRPSATGGAR